MTQRSDTIERASASPGQRFAGRRGAVVLFSSYPDDPRPRRATEALAAEGMEMDVVCLKAEPDEPSSERIGNVYVRRLPIRHHRSGKLRYTLEYGMFLLAALLILAFRGVRRRYSIVHVHNMPDILVFAAIVPKLLGAKVLLDLHDPMPELMRTIYGLPPSGRSIRVLELLERWSIGFSDAAITVNEACRRIFAGRSCRAAKLHVIMNSPDEAIFGYRVPDPSTRANLDRPFVIMYHGTLVERNGLGLAVEALANVRSQVPGAELRVFGRPTPYGEQVRQLVSDRGLSGAVRFLGERSLEQLVEAINEVDVGVIPNQRSIFTEINTPTRIFEYLARGLPVVAPRAPGIMDYFGESELFLFELGNAADLTRALLRVHADPEEARRCVERGQAVYRAHRWSQERLSFLALVSRLLGVRAEEPEAVDQFARPA